VGVRFESRPRGRWASGRASAVVRGCGPRVRPLGRASAVVRGCRGPGPLGWGCAGGRGGRGHAMRRGCGAGRGAELAGVGVPPPRGCGGHGCRAVAAGPRESGVRWAWAGVGLGLRWAGVAWVAGQGVRWAWGQGVESILGPELGRGWAGGAVGMGSGGAVGMGRGGHGGRGWAWGAVVVGSWATVGQGSGVAVVGVRPRGGGGLGVACPRGRGVAWVPPPSEGLPGGALSPGVSAFCGYVSNTDLYPPQAPPHGEYAPLPRNICNHRWKIDL
jgi:hypothetical protein